MDCSKVGALIAQLRKNKKMTQKQLADKLMLSDRTISKWERGIGLPDVSLLTELADILDVPIESLLNGEMVLNDWIGGNMKKTRYFVCKTCGNILLSTGEAAVSCCDKRMLEETAHKANEAEKLNIEEIDNEWYITSAHPMEKGHYLSFVAFATASELHFVKQYPEWNLQVRLPKRKHGTLLWYCTKHGLFYQYL